MKRRIFKSCVLHWERATCQIEKYFKETHGGFDHLANVDPDECDFCKEEEK